MGITRFKAHERRHLNNNSGNEKLYYKAQTFIELSSEKRQSFNIRTEFVMRH